MSDFPSHSSKNSIVETFTSCRDALARWLIQNYISPDEVEDVLQEAFLKTYAMSNRRKIKSPKAYLFMTARNIVFKQFKKNARIANLDISGMDVDSGEIGLEAALLERERFSKFLQAIDSLPDQCRTVFIMRKFNGLSIRNIAQELGISPKTVENHMTKALRRCGRKLAIYEGAESSQKQASIAPVDLLGPNRKE